MRAEDVVAEALSWRGTPHADQQSVKGAGCDCKGFVVGVARELGRPEAASLYGRMQDYRKIDCRLLKQGLGELFDQVNEMQPGDILLLRMIGRPQHLGIVGHDVLIHSYGRGPAQVTCTNLRAAIRLWPIDSIWRWRGLD